MSGEPIRDDNAIPLTPGQEAIWCEACELWWPCECEETAVDAHATIETVGADGRPVDEGEEPTTLTVDVEPEGGER